MSQTIVYKYEYHASPINQSIELLTFVLEFGASDAGDPQPVSLRLFRIFKHVRKNAFSAQVLGDQGFHGGENKVW